MPEISQPSTVERWMADTDRRLRNLESAQRVGLGSIEIANQDVQATLTTYDTWVQTGLPEVTLNTGEVVVVGCGSLVGQFGEMTGLRAAEGIFGFGIDGQDPDQTLNIISKRQFVWNGTTSRVYTPLSFFALIDTLERGEHTFSMWMYAVLQDPGAGTHPIFDDTWIMVIPIDTP